MYCIFRIKIIRVNSHFTYLTLCYNIIIQYVIYMIRTIAYMTSLLYQYNELMMVVLLNMK